MGKGVLRRAVVIAMAASLVFTPSAAADPQCWDRYSTRNNPDCNGGAAPGQLPGSGGGAPNGGGLLGTIGRVLGGIL